MKEKIIIKHVKDLYLSDDVTIGNITDYITDVSVDITNNYLSADNVISGNITSCITDYITDVSVDITNNYLNEITKA
jgi:hypothetical protein